MSDDVKVVRVETLNSGDILAQGPRRTPVIKVTHGAGKVFVWKCNESPYPLVYRRRALVTILKTARI